ncbi:hypothetical protein [Halorussus ruber]|uniref:hypothetical protein n=1 Tax=Halorussus ruber TaxID=1126238 RepID=UPI00109256E8|nr:hypothetical protein [Halorussus ruber]
MRDADQVPDYWNDWKLDEDEFNHIIHNNSNALSAIFGYVAEERVREMYLEDCADIENIRTPKDQDSADKGDWAFQYNGEPMKIEVKSLQTHTIEKVDSHQTTLDNGSKGIEWKAGFHIKGTSDQRVITHEGDEYETTLMDVEKTDIDIMAINLYRLEDEWRFAFVKIEDLPRSGGNYPEGLREKLAKSVPKLTVPLEDPYTDDPYELMDEILEDREN